MKFGTHIEKHMLSPKKRKTARMRLFSKMAAANLKIDFRLWNEQLLIDFDEIWYTHSETHAEFN
jgi:hypothetical protein